MEDVIATLSPVQSKVFLTLCVFIADPVELSVKDICDFGCLSRQSVVDALRSLCRSELVECHTGPDQSRRYRPHHKYFRYRASPVSMRDRIRSSEPAKVIAEPNRHVHGTLTSDAAAVAREVNLSGFINDSEMTPKEQQQQLPELRQLLIASYPQVGEPLRSKCLRRLTRAKYRQWFEEWVPDAPKRFTKPAVFAATQLALDPTANPPDPEPEPQHSPGWWDPEFTIHVHGRPEHIRWCREHPDHADCECATMLLEGESE